MKINIINQDCMGALRGMPDKLFDLAIVDPPFGLGEDGGNRGRGNRPFTTSPVPDTEHAHQKRIHPTQKPVELYEWLLLTFGGTSANILDTHHGSGSLAVACLRLGFDLTAYEIDPEYFRLAVGRVREELRQQELFTFRAARQVPGLRPRIFERTRDEDRFCLEAEYAPAGQ